MTLHDWRETWAGRVHGEGDVVPFVDAVGCCSINALERVPALPSLGAVMGKPHALWDAWFWKDDLHIAKRLYYTRLFAGRPGFIALDWLPVFIAANGAAADELILTGALPVETVALYRLIEERGPISIRDIGRVLGKGQQAGLWELERRFIVTKTGISGRERGTYGYIWDLAERWLPDAFTAADRLREPAARTRIRDHLVALGVPVDARLRQRVLRWE
jgi:hypothetical protein